MARPIRYGHTHGNGSCARCRVGIHSDDCAYRADDGVGPRGSFLCHDCAAALGYVASGERCY